MNQHKVVLTLFLHMLVVSCTPSNESVKNESYFIIDETNFLITPSKIQPIGTTKDNSGSKPVQTYDPYSSYTDEDLRAFVESACRRDVPSHFKYPYTVSMNWIDGVKSSGTRSTGIVVAIPLTAENQLGMPMNHIATCILKHGSNTVLIKID